MFRNKKWIAVLCTLVLATASVCAGCAHVGSRTALDRYVAAADSSFGFRQDSEIKGEGYTAYVVDMTSQTWRSDKDVNKPVWKHWVTIVRPDKVEGDTALLFVSGGSNEKPAPTSVDKQMAIIAVKTNSVVVSLAGVPSEPLEFTDEERTRTEDEIISYTYDKYMVTGDETWPLLLPMAKSAVRAMDTTQQVMANLDNGSVKIDKFVVCGGSKRGWTTWLTAAVDPRVIGIIPAVIDVPNLDEQMAHHHAAYGFYSPSVHDYVDKDIFVRFDTKEGQELLKIVDPYEYRDRYTMPKLMLNSGGDQFFLPDSSQFYFEDMPGEKYLRYVPNTDHGLDNSDAWYTVLAFYSAVQRGFKRPEFNWTVESDGAIRVTTKDAPLQVNLWQVTNPDARDFRLETIGPKWESAELKGENGVYVGRVAAPAKGWTAYMVELTYDSGIDIPLKFTTQVCVIPDVLPFAKK